MDFPLLARASKTAAYLLALAGGFAAGRFAALGLAALLAASSGPLFVALCLLALAVLAAGYRLENRWLWGRWFEPDADHVRQIGTRSQLLGGAALPPVSLGIALGLLSVLVP